MKDLAHALEKNRNLILEAERHIWEHPETGYREYETSNYLANKFEGLGYKITRAGDIPGFFTIIDTGREGPEVLILGELDSLICPEHSEADEITGYVHACGHNVQAASLLGIAATLKEESALDKLCGRIRLCAVPAEELIELSYRKELKAEGKIKYLVGKSEFLHRGYFDGVDLAFMVHASSHYAVNQGNIGCIAKTILYKGTSAHAGGAPWDGKNALYAATQGLAAVNSLRETFNETDLIRFHPIITHGGDAVNAIPELVSIEAYVRGASLDAMKKTNQKINQALCGAALSIGVNIEINDLLGYSPLLNDQNMIDVVTEAAGLVIPEEDFYSMQNISTGSTDMGELCGLMPVVHPYSSGISGTTHGDDYEVADKEKACIKSAKLQLAMLHILLSDGAKRAKKILREFKPLYKSKEEYFATIDSFNSGFCGERIIYNNNFSAQIRI